MAKRKLKYEDKPIHKVGDEFYCITEKRNVVIDGVNDGRDYSDMFRPDYKDGLVYDIIMGGEAYTGYHWWDFKPKMGKILEIVKDNGVRHTRYATMNAPGIDANFFEGRVDNLLPLAQVKRWAWENNYTHVKLFAILRSQTEKLYTL